MGKKNISTIVYTDGGCAVNPGGQGAYAAIVLKDGKEYAFSQGFRSTTNNRMEMMAIIRALEETEGDVKIYSDSQYAINTFSGVWNGKKNIDLQRKYKKLVSRRHVEFEWVRGHNGNEYNERCDELCTKTMFGEELLDDAEYDGERKEYIENEKRLQKKKENGGAMGVEIETQAKFNNEPEKMSPKEYAIQYDVNTSCAEAIIRFYKNKNKSFKAYMSLKTDGRDTWSTKTKDEILFITSAEEKVSVIEDHLSSKSAQMSALRWYCRGLTLEDAIRKALVDEEVSESALASGARWRQ